jgi:hypothetical protein
MQARVVAGVVGCGISLLTVVAGAQARSATFPSEATSDPPAAPVPAEPAPVRAGEAPPVTTAPTAMPSAPAPSPISTTPLPVVPAEATQPKPVPSWNVGAGIFSRGSLMMPVEQSVATYNATLEHRLGRRAWLALNARFSYVTREAPVYATTTDANPAGTYRVSTSSAGVLLGARYVFAQGLVDVSGSAVAFLNYQHVKGAEAGGALAGFPGSRRELGLLLGMTVERELIEALALRLSLDLASAGVGFQDSLRIDDVGVEQTRILVTGRLALAIEPGLNLHFYF